MWQTLVKEPYSLVDYWAPLMAVYPKINMDQLRNLMDQTVMNKPLSIGQAVKEILYQFNIKNNLLADKITRRWKYSCDNSLLFDDVMPALKKLKGKGYIMILITNTSQYGWERINSKYGLGNYFDFVVKSFELGAVKPEIAVFEYVESMIGDFSTENITMVGDSYDTDIMPAQSRGWKTIQITRDNKKFRPNIRNKIKVIKSLADVEKYI